MGKPSASRRTARLVLTAIKKSGEKNGVTLNGIMKFIKEKFPNDKAPPGKLKKALERAVALGAVERNRRRYQLGNVMKYVNKVSRGGRRGKRGRRRRGLRRRGPG